MAIKRHACAHHPERDAMGVCVETRVPLCSECATVHEGVFLSRKALEARREARERAASRGGAGWLLALLASPPLFAAMWWFLKLNIEGVIHLLKASGGGKA